MFIVFEGLDGSGKSTISKKIFSILNKKYKVIFTKEPCGTSFKKKFKNLISTINSKNFFESEILLFEAERIIHLKEKIIPAIKEKKIVISDRFIDSSLVYQGLKNNFDLKKILNLHKNFSPKLIPDLTFYFYADEKTLLERIKKRKKIDKFDDEVLKNIIKYKDYYENLYKNYKISKKIIKIDNTKRTINSILKEVLSEIYNFLGNN